MKKIIFFLIALSLILCSCEAPQESEIDSVSDEIAETQPATNSETLLETSHIVDSQPETEEPPEAELPPATIEELLERYIPPFDSSKDPNWKQKLIPISPYHAGVYSGTHYGSKFAARITVGASAPISDEVISALREAIFQFDGRELTDQQCRQIIHETYAARFIEQYVDDPNDVFSSYDDGWYKIEPAVGIFATQEEIEKYAQCPHVGYIISGDDFYITVNLPAVQA